MVEVLVDFSSTEGCVGSVLFHVGAGPSSKFSEVVEASFVVILNVPEGKSG